MTSHLVSSARVSFLPRLSPSPLSLHSSLSFFPSVSIMSGLRVSLFLAVTVSYTWLLLPWLFVSYTCPFKSNNLCLCVCVQHEPMSNVMRIEMKEGWERGQPVAKMTWSSLQGHLTGVTLIADWLIPCPLSNPWCLEGGYHPKVIHANTCWNTTPVHTYIHAKLRLILGEAWRIVTFPFRLLQACYSNLCKPQVIPILRRAEWEADGGQFGLIIIRCPWKNRMG